MPFGRIFVLSVCLEFDMLLCSRRYCVNPSGLLLEFFFQNSFFYVINNVQPDWVKSAF